MAASMGTNPNVQVIYSTGIEILGDTANNPKVSVDGTFYSKAAFTDNVDVRDSGGGSRKRRQLVVTANHEAYFRESIKTVSRANTGLISQTVTMKWAPRWIVMRSTRRNLRWLERTLLKQAAEKVIHLLHYGSRRR